MSCRSGGQRDWSIKRHCLRISKRKSARLEQRAEFDKKTGALLCDDCGYIGKLKTGQRISTQNLSHLPYSLNEKILQINADFYVVNQPIPDPQKFLFLRMFNLTIGRFQCIREWVKKILVNTLLKNNKKVKYNLDRKVIFSFPLHRMLAAF